MKGNLRNDQKGYTQFFLNALNMSVHNPNIYCFYNWSKLKNKQTNKTTQISWNALQSRYNFRSFCFAWTFLACN